MKPAGAGLLLSSHTKQCLADTPLQLAKYFCNKSSVKAKLAYKTFTEFNQAPQSTYCFIDPGRMGNISELHFPLPPGSPVEIKGPNSTLASCRQHLLELSGNRANYGTRLKRLKYRLDHSSKSILWQCSNLEMPVT